MIETSLRMLFALLTPWLLGYIIVTFLLNLRSIKSISISIGYGYFFGWIAIYSIIKMATYIDNNVDITKVFYAVVVLVFVLYFKINGLKHNLHSIPAIFRINKTLKFSLLVLTLFVITRVASLGFELIMQPMFPWDAYTAWIPKAKLWYHMNELTEVVSFWEWRDKLNMPNNLYIHDSASEKELIPIVVLWMAVMTDTWDEGIIFIPWLLILIAFCFGFYGQASLAKACPIKTGLLLALLMTLPILNAHSALAGYADLWLGLSFGLAVAAMYQWEVEKSLSQLVLYFAMTWMCYITKSESGFIWSIILFMGFFIVVSNITLKNILIILTSSALMLILLIKIGMDIEVGSYAFRISEKSISIPGLFMGNLSHEYTSRITTIFHNLLIAQNWNSIWYLVLLSIAFKCNKIIVNLKPGTVFVIYSTAIVFMFYMIFKEFYSRPADTIINRALLHLIPAYIFVLCLPEAIEPDQRKTTHNKANKMQI